MNYKFKLYFIIYKLFIYYINKLINKMSQINELQNLNIKEDNSETNLSILIYKKNGASILETLESTLDKIKKIDNPIKRGKLSTNYFNLKKMIEDFYMDSIISSIFFVNEKVYEYKLNKNEMKVMEEYKIRDYLSYSDFTFKNAYFYDLFYNFDFNYSFIINKNEYIIKKWNQNKDKVVESGKISASTTIKDNYESIRKVHNHKNNIYIYGNNVKDIATYSNPKVVLENDDYSRNELNEISVKEEMKANHLILQNRLNDLQNEKKIDLYVFGKLKFEIKDAIEAYLIKELFIQKEKYEKLQTFIEDKSAFNFKVYFIDKIENGDIGEQFIQNYNGIMGVKYY